MVIVLAMVLKMVPACVFPVTRTTVDLKLLAMLPAVMALSSLMQASSVIPQLPLLAVRTAVLLPTLLPAPFLITMVVVCLIAAIRKLVPAVSGKLLEPHALVAPITTFAGCASVALLDSAFLHLDLSAPIATIP